MPGPAKASSGAARMAAMTADAFPLFPAGQPFARDWLTVPGGHRLYVEQRGAPDGIPAVVLHGGPGSGCSPALAGFFDPRRYRVILADQRGAGQSQPVGGLGANRTADLLADLERLRGHLGIDRWLAVGGSWGGTLGVLYAAAQPAAVSGLLLRNPFLARPADLDWFFSGARARHPAGWRRWRALGAPEEAGAMLPWLVERFRLGADAELLALAQVWQRWESTLAGSAAGDLDEAALRLRVARYRLQLHYFAHACFLPDNAVPAAAASLAAGLPVHVLQGLADDVCPAAATRELLARLPGAGVDWIEGVGHDPFAPAMRQATLRALAAFAARGRFD